MFIGEFSCLLRITCISHTDSWYVHWGVFLSLKNHLYISHRLLVCSLGEFSCLLRITCISHTDSWYVHWGVFLSLKNHLFISHRLLVCSLGSFPVSKESPAYLLHAVDIFLVEFSCLLRITCLSHTDCWYVHWGVFLSLKNHLFISHRQLVCSLGSFPVS